MVVFPVIIQAAKSIACMRSSGPTENCDIFQTRGPAAACIGKAEMLLLAGEEIEIIVRQTVFLVFQKYLYCLFLKSSRYQ